MYKLHVDFKSRWPKSSASTDRSISMAAPSSYSTNTVPPLGGGRFFERGDPTPYSTGAVPSLAMADVNLAGRDTPTPYATNTVPPLAKRDDPTPYSTNTVPPLAKMRIVRRDQPVPYSTNAVPPLGERDTPTPYATNTIPPLKPRDIDPTPYASNTVPPLAERDVAPTPYSSNTVPPLMKRDDPTPYSTNTVPPLLKDRGYLTERSPQTALTTTVGSTATQAPTQTADVTTSTTVPLSYLQLGGATGTPRPYIFYPPTLDAADYTQICSDGNCLTDCQNISRVFQPVPSGISIDESTYGKAVPKGDLPDLTLFGVCSNLDYMSQIAQYRNASTSFSSYFPTTNAPAALHNVSNDLSMCFFDTCQASRDPSQCHNECSLDSLRNTDTSINVRGGVYPCLYKLCHNTCGLPYANQDVYGVGVLASYIIQAILVLILAVLLIAFASWRFFKRNDANKKTTIPKRMKESADLFLAAECYFGISASIASYLMHPSTVDPLNGYALLSVAITGFIPTTFTLMLLHSHGIKSLYTSFLTFLSWLFSSVLFFMLVRNLDKTVHNEQAIDHALNTLFDIDTCGHSSAMSLCKQTFDTDPLAYLSWFYNYWNIPSIKTVPILWVLSTVVLLILFMIQTLERLRSHGRGTATNSTIDYQPFNQTRKRTQKAVISLLALYLGSILYGLAFGYQGAMVRAYTRMDVINWHGWSFGQVVALLFWIPPLFDSIRVYIIQGPSSPPSSGADAPKYAAFQNRDEKQAYTAESRVWLPAGATREDLTTPSSSTTRYTGFESMPADMVLETPVQQFDTTYQYTNPDQSRNSGLNSDQSSMKGSDEGAPVEQRTRKWRKGGTVTTATQEDESVIR